MFANERKRTDKDPDFTGHGLCGGVEVWASMWVKRSKKTGEEFFSISIRRKDEQRRQPNDGYQSDQGSREGSYRQGPTNFQRATQPRGFEARPVTQDYPPSDDEGFRPEFGSDWEREA